MKPHLSRAVQVAFFIYLMYALVAAFVPLLSNFGFEFHLFLAAAVGVFAAVTTVDLFFRRFPETQEETRVESILSVGVLNLAAQLVLIQLALAGIPAALHALVSLATHATCNWSMGLAWMALLAPVTVVYSTLWGMLIAAFLKTRRFAMVVAGIFAVAGILLSVYEMAAGSHCFAYNPFFGYFPGPIYDRVVNISWPFVAFRFSNLATAVFVGCFLSVVLKISLRRGGRQEPKVRAPEVTIGIACLLAVLIFSSYRDELGLSGSKRQILRELSGQMETDHFILHFPPDGAVADQIDLIAADHEFRYHQITSELNIRFPRKINSFIYLSDDQKKRLQGAGGTMYADVSNASIHMSHRGFPHPVLKHEMTHVITAVWGIPYFGWSARLGLTEGIAVAEEGYREDGAIHDWAAAMKRLGRLPDIVAIMDPAGFWTKTGSRAYLAAGSFSLWLIQSEGLDRFRDAYKWGRFEQVYDVPLDILRDDWLAFLDTVQVSPRLMAQARHKFTRKSLFEQTCVREMERLLDRGERQMERGRYHDAIRAFRKARQYAPDHPDVGQALMNAYIGAKYYDRAEAIGSEILQSQGGIEAIHPGYEGPFSAKPILRALIEMARLDWMQGRTAEAAAKYEQIRQADFDEQYTRLALCALTALNDENLASFLKPYFASEIPQTSRMYYLVRAVQEFPQTPVPRYLLGRNLYADREYYTATSHLLAALKNNDLPPSLRKEGLFTLAKALYFQKRFTESLAVFEILQGQELSNGFHLEAREWTARVEFTRDHFTKDHAQPPENRK